MREPKQSLGTIVPLAILLLTVFFAGPLQAQRMISPVNTEHILDSTLSGVTTINCDMFDCPIAGGKMMAVAYDSAGYVCVKTWHSSNPGKVFRVTPLPGSDPDVIIADDKLYPGKKAFLLVSCIRNNRVEVRRYAVTLVGRSGYTVNPTAGVLAISPKTAIAKSPRLDAFPDTSLTINGYPSFTEYVVSYVENGDSLIALRGNSRTGATGFTRFPLLKLDPTKTTVPDVAAISNVANSNKIAFFTYTTSAGLFLKEMNFTTNTGAAAIQLSSNTQIHESPRIEAMNFYDPSATAVKWQVVSSEYNTSASRWDIQAYNDMSAYNCSEVIGSLNNEYTPAVCAGMGTLGSGFFAGNTNYIFGWRQDNTNDMFANYVDVVTGQRASSTGTIYYNDTTYHQDTIVLYDTLNFVNTTYIVDTNISYILDTTYTYIIDTSYGRGNGNGNSNDHGNGHAYGHDNGKGHAYGRNNSGYSIDTTDIIVTIDTLEIITTIDTTDIINTDSTSIISRDSIFTVMTVVPMSRIGDVINFYQINNNSCGTNTPMAISSATNTGNGVLSVWFDGSNMKYKIVSNTSGFKGEGSEDEIEEGPFRRTVADAANDRNIRIYPNPAHDLLTVEGTDITAVAITDVAGRLVLKADLHDSSVDVSGLQAGIYIINFIQEDGTLVSPTRFVKY